MTDHKPETVTPTEDLVLEVLAARRRLGERLWTFDSRHKQTLGRLADRGLVTTMHGIVEKTIRASLTAQGEAVALDGKYESPLGSLCKKIIDVHDHVEMDTPEDRDLHDRAVSTFREALAGIDPRFRAAETTQATTTSKETE